MGIQDELNIEQINEELSKIEYGNWNCEKLNDEYIVKISSDELNNYFITVQEWSNSYLVIPYIPSPQENKNSPRYNEEQQRISDNLDDALFHSKLLIQKWNQII